MLETKTLCKGFVGSAQQCLFTLYRIKIWIYWGWCIQFDRSESQLRVQNWMCNSKINIWKTYKKGKILKREKGHCGKSKACKKQRTREALAWEPSESPHRSANPLPLTPVDRVWSGQSTVKLDLLLGTGGGNLPRGMEKNVPAD